MSCNYILVAEDDADDRFLLETVFAEKGFEQKLIFVENGFVMSWEPKPMW